MELSGHYIKGTGDFEIKELSAQDSVLKELDKGKQYWECMSAGTFAELQPYAYGEWEFIIYRFDAGTTPSYAFISDSILSTGNRYRININGGRIELYKDSTELFRTINSYIDSGVLYRIKITRTLDGEFMVYVKGGDFGIDDWTLVSVSGGAGTNPVTDNTYTESFYQVIDLDVGDRYIPGVQRKGVQQ